MRRWEHKRRKLDSSGNTGAVGTKNQYRWLSRRSHPARTRKGWWRISGSSLSRRSVGTCQFRRDASSRHRCPNWFGRFASRMQLPAGPSRGARNWPSSEREIRWRLCRGCAWDTYHTRCSSEFIKAFRIPDPNYRISLSEVRAGYPNPGRQTSISVTIAFKCMG
jgi:hypothetical protein